MWFGFMNTLKQLKYQHYMQHNSLISAKWQFKEKKRLDLLPSKHVIWLQNLMYGLLVQRRVIETQPQFNKDEPEKM